MLTVSVEEMLAASADTLWDCIGGFNTLADWHPGIEKSIVAVDRGQTVRTLTLANGATITERLEQASDIDRSYTYTLIESPLPIINHHSTLTVSDAGAGRCIVSWSAAVEMDQGAAANDRSRAEATVSDLYQAGFVALRERFAA